LSAKLKTAVGMQRCHLKVGPAQDIGYARLPDLQDQSAEPTARQRQQDGRDMIRRYRNLCQFSAMLGCRFFVLCAALAVLALLWPAGELAAQTETAPAPAAPETRAVLRFATTDDFPPFSARDEENALVGFNIDLAQAICLDLERTCEISTHAWGDLLDVLDRGQVDAVIASHRINVETLAKADFTTPYFRTPGRFAARRDGATLTVSPTGLDRRSIGVTKRTAHEAFIQTFFRTSNIVRFDTPEAARAALRDKKVDLIFDDGISLVFWINGTASRGCCDLAGGPYLEPLFFGDGIGIAVKRGNRTLRADLNEALIAVRENGRMLELMQRYFPRRVY
jgi:polar amino acid transport system substrate-binding protein